MTLGALGDDMGKLGSARLIAHIDLDVIAENWMRLHAQGDAEVGAVVKAQAYGHGMAPVVKRLVHQGCRRFFTASLDEAIAIRQTLPSHEYHIAYFDGFDGNDSDAILSHHLVPAINSNAQLSALEKLASREGRPIPAMLGLDTGMNRLGGSNDEAETMLNSPQLKAGDWQLVFSHLITADTPLDSLNKEQLARFDKLQRKAPPAPRSLAATGGIMLGPDYHFDVTRPGLGLYGISPREDDKREDNHPDYNPLGLKPAMSLSAKILQIRHAKAGETVGYNATHILKRDSVLATIAGGYADGINRRLSDTGQAAKDGLMAKMVGRVSMDVHVLDITDWPENTFHEGGRVMLIDDVLTASDMAKKIGTIPYEVLTTLGLRAKPLYASSIMEQLDL